MTTQSFEHTAKVYLLGEFKDRLNVLKENYTKVQNQFNELTDELDKQPINEEYLQEICTNLSVYLSEMDIIQNKIEEISEIVAHVKMELSN